MRLGVLDVGSNTVHLLVVDAHPGARPLPAHSHKAELRLAQLHDESGAIGLDGVEKLIATVRDAATRPRSRGPAPPSPAVGSRQAGEP
ncbi:Ppx/GppA family phosphatase, partial [Micrococcus luteus]